MANLNKVMKTLDAAYRETNRLWTETKDETEFRVAGQASAALLTAITQLNAHIAKGGRK